MSTDVGSPYEQLRLRCGFGRLGLCCADCLRGPCRLSPFDEAPGRGICGRDADALVAHQLARVMVDGLATLLAEHPPGEAPGGMERSVVELVAALARTGEGDDWQAMLGQVRETAGRAINSLPIRIRRDKRESECSGNLAGGVLTSSTPELPSPSELAEALRAGQVKGVALLVDHIACAGETVALAQDFLRAGMLCLLAGCISADVAASGLLSEDVRPPMGRGLGEFLEEYELPNVCYSGGWRSARFILAYARRVRDNASAERLSLAVAFPGLSSPTIAAIALGMAAQGVAAHTGASLPVGGSAAVMDWLASPPRYSGIAPLFTAAEPPSPRQIVAQLTGWLERA